MQKMVTQKEVPDNTVFWSIVGIVSVFVVVLAVVTFVKSDITGNIVLQWYNPSLPYLRNPMACLDVPMCGSSNSYMCCAEETLPSGMKCTAPLYTYVSQNSQCPASMPNMCPCPEKYPYRQSWPVPTR
jgi:hypothetical protein